MYFHHEYTLIGSLNSHMSAETMLLRHIVCPCACVCARVMVGSWHVLFLGPLLVRLLAQVNYQRNASIMTARFYMKTLEKNKQAKEGREDNRQQDDSDKNV